LHATSLPKKTIFGVANSLSNQVEFFDSFKRKTVTFDESKYAGQIKPLIRYINEYRAIDSAKYHLAT
jgi:hypothetical protein